MTDLKKGAKGAAHTQAPRVTVKDTVRFWLNVMGTLGVTRRQLSTNTGIEIATLCAALKALENEGVCEVKRTATCTTTGREVAVYTLKGIE